jgi:hypothetical protein
MFSDTSNAQVIHTTLKAGFNQAYGKYPVAYGNVVLMDCHHFYDLIFKALNNAIEPLKQSDPI